MGGAGREIPFAPEFFETNGASAFAVNSGSASGAREQLALRAEAVEHPHAANMTIHQSPHFPSARAVGTFGKLNVRNGGDNWNQDMMRRDILRAGETDNDHSLPYRPTVVHQWALLGYSDIRKMFDPVSSANEHQLRWTPTIRPIRP